MIKINQWWIQDFPEGRLQPQGGGANLLFWSICLKTAWKYKWTERRGVSIPGMEPTPLGSANANCKSRLSHQNYLKQYAV